MTGSDPLPDALATAAAQSWVEEDAIASGAPAADVLGPRLRADLAAWVDALIPAEGSWPAASETGVVRYVEAVAERVPAFRPDLIEMLRGGADGVRAFADLSPAERVGRMQAVEAGPRSATFRRVYELACEQYYRAPAVVRVVRERTGFDSRRARAGVPMAPFDERLLDRVRALPARFPGRIR